MKYFCNEISILSRLRHPNGIHLRPTLPKIIYLTLSVILFLNFCITPPHLSLATEYMEMSSLYCLIHMSGQKKKLSWRRRLKMLRDICSLGVVMWEFCSLNRPWEGVPPVQVVNAVANEESRLEIPPPAVAS